MENFLQSECPYQKGRSTIICEACRLMLPSIDEVRNYCEKNYLLCPHFNAAETHTCEEVDALP